MRKVKNRKVLTLLADRILKAKKRKNSIAVFAIVLTTVLFTSVFTIGGNILHTTTENSMTQVGTRYHAGYKNFTM